MGRDRLPHLFALALLSFGLLRFCFRCALCDHLGRPHRILPPAQRLDKVRDDNNNEKREGMMLAAGVSRYERDPLKALERAKRKRA
ncbi:MAG: hypothetical protein WBW99_21700 [Pseudolabrys sp.]